MSRDKVEHYYLLTTLSNLNIWNATWNPHKEDPRGCRAHCIKVPKWQVNAVPNRWEGTIKKPRSYSEICFVLVCGFWLFFLSFRHSYCASPKALHDQQYKLETLGDWYFVNKKYCTKGLAWSAIPIRNTKRLNFCEQNLQETDQFKTFWRFGNFSGECCLA
jgi:hypothetical protein